MTKQAVIFYFSGTSKTKWVSEQLASAFTEHHSCQVQLISIETCLRNPATYA